MTSNARENEYVRHYSGVGSQPYSAPEVYYVRELYQGRGYRGQSADLWSSAVLLFVMLTGRPPFVRPLAKTYGAHLRRCRHFVALQAGQGLDMLHPHAKDLILKLLKIQPSERLTLEEVRKHPWMQGSVPTEEELCKLMEERSMKCWNSSNTEMTHVLSKMRLSRNNNPSSNTATPIFGGISPSASPPFTALNSPSFSASSVPPSPYTTGQHHSHSHHPSTLLDLRSHSPLESIGHGSPASFLHAHATSTPSLSPAHQLSTPSAQVRHATLNVPPPSAPFTTTNANLQHQRTIAQSINPSTSSIFPQSNLQVTLLQMNAPERHDEIPPYTTIESAISQESIAASDGVAPEEEKQSAMKKVFDDSSINVDVDIGSMTIHGVDVDPMSPLSIDPSASASSTLESHSSLHPLPTKKRLIRFSSFPTQSSHHGEVALSSSSPQPPSHQSIGSSTLASTFSYSFPPTRRARLEATRQDSADNATTSAPFTIWKQLKSTARTENDPNEATGSKTRRVEGKHE